MKFWCSALEVPWTWRFQAYPGVWAAVLAIAIPYVLAQRARTGPNPERRRQSWFFAAGVAAFWLATDWPLGLLGASYLAFVHMIQFVLYSMVAAPLLMLGVPEWMVRQRLGRLRLYRLSCIVAKPVTAAAIFNLTLIATHSPWAVDMLRSTQFGSFIMDAAWLLVGLIVWLPILSPLPEQRMTSYPGKMTYLFLALGVVPAVPAGFLTFSTFPLYSTYELAPRVHEIAAGTDQRLAGLVMKLGGIPVVWGAIVAMMNRWAKAEGYGEPKQTPTSVR
jgi:putative membrane protein